MKRVAIVTGHFPPSNLASVHRSRLWAQHLTEFGWLPTIVTTQPEYYEEMIDEDLLDLVSPDLRVIRTRAIPTKPIRLIGDIGLRGLYWHLKAVDRLIRNNEIDFLLCTIPSNYTALLGQIIYQRHNFPFGIDYIDPWVYTLPATEKPLSKAWLSLRLAQVLEPWAVRNACLITGVAPLYYDAVLERNRRLRDRCITASMPYGYSEMDFKLLKKESWKKRLFDKNDGYFHFVYAGAMLPQAYEILDRLLGALALLRDTRLSILERVRVHFIGTGKSPNDVKGYNIRPRVQQFGLERWVDEHPSRISYTDVLHHLLESSAILVLGSTEAHYSPSKVYQAVQAKRPVFALLHEQSTAVSVLRESKAGTVVTFGESTLPATDKLAEVISAFVMDQKYCADHVDWTAFEAYSARNSTRLIAAAMDEAMEEFRKLRSNSPVGAESNR
jgi:hypothetical protein